MNALYLNIQVQKKKRFILFKLSLLLAAILKLVVVAMHLYGHMCHMVQVSYITRFGIFAIYTALAPAALAV